MNKFALIITCEHGGNVVPPEYEELFRDYEERLASHEGYDIGALDLAKAISEALSVHSFFATTTRLLIELNRSLHHPKLFSSITQSLSDATKEHVIATYYVPYQTNVIEKIKTLIEEGLEVIHISVHSFTPVFNGETRNADIGLLYDSKRLAEKDFCTQWQKVLKQQAPTVRVRMNYPYNGSADGFTTALRKIFLKNYIGMEIEVNHQLLIQPGAERDQITQTLIKSLHTLFADDSSFTPD